ncbi:UDP-N-acetyl-D-mannosamine dehydrogenase [Qipengyuania sp. XHP0207]|uniref:UDP-N-acetyl-D-mannosamine dehydrogenase n=1 Tax=Qipengyuania sp. XHP0207 TaxID=3038078 RepID=UPI00241C50FF|nr:UDP-N-acetyl-D-mannosamine dehydrogenase [Qipengyuania sp. XHP0207]MDG5747292.1 UDP-N-acetyl-D-mannosamine dehydrogenase [Qipengyuania sp. XHP0207]
MDISEPYASAGTENFDVCVFGLGYIGLPTASVIASAGLRVCGVDTSARVVETINRGAIHIEEKDLDQLVERVVKQDMLVASHEAAAAKFHVIAVPTPLGDDRQPGLASVMSAAETIAPRLRPGDCVILESTSPVGTTERIAQLIARLRPDLGVPGSTHGPADIAIAYCPERVLPGKILAELRSNDRVIGGMTPACAIAAKRLYAQFVLGVCFDTNAAAAEMVKLVENSFRDVNIAFANELSLVADRFGINVWEVIRLANRHPRVNILQPGPGVGGHCIAVDPWFLVAAAPEETPLIRTAREVNLNKTEHVVARLLAMASGESDAKIAVLGLAFKPDIDDLRESPAMEVANRLATEFGSRLMIVEPFVDELPERLAETGASLCDLPSALAEADIHAILVDHTDFKHLTLRDFAGKQVYDTRGLLEA